MALLVTASLTPAEALRAATLTPAQMMGVDGSHGEIAVGRVADMVLLSDDPLADIANTRNIAGVLLRGAWLPRADLDRALADVQALRQR